jgi:hypothetical protein
MVVSGDDDIGARRHCGGDDVIVVGIVWHRARYICGFHADGERGVEFQGFCNLPAHLVKAGTALGADGLDFFVYLIHDISSMPVSWTSFAMSRRRRPAWADRFDEKLFKRGGGQQPGLTRGFSGGFGQIDLDHGH